MEILFKSKPIWIKIKDYFGRIVHLQKSEVRSDASAEKSLNRFYGTFPEIDAIDQIEKPIAEVLHLHGDGSLTHGAARALHHPRSLQQRPKSQIP